MTPLMECLKLFWAFFKIGVIGFGGGYGMLSMIMVESLQFSVTLEQLADLNALDMVIPGPIAINAATYIGYLHAGFWGSLAATIGLIAPSLLIVALVLRFIDRYRQNHIMQSALSGIKPAVVGLVATASVTIASGVLVNPGSTWQSFWADPLRSVSWLLGAIFVATVVANVRFKVNPILLTAIAGTVGALAALT